MTKKRAEQIIVISLVVMLASTVGGSLAEGKTGTKFYGRKIVGGFLSIFLLSLLAEVAPPPAAYMSMAMASYAALHYGLPAINKTGTASKIDKKGAASETPTFTEPPEIMNYLGQLA